MYEYNVVKNFNLKIIQKYKPKNHNISQKMGNSTSEIDEKHRYSER